MIGLKSQTEDDLIGRSPGIVRERNGVHDFQTLDEFFFCSPVILMGTVYSTVDIAHVPSDFEKGNDTSGDRVVVLKKFHRSPDEGAVQEECDKCIPVSLCIKMACAGKDGSQCTSYGG